MIEAQPNFETYERGLLRYPPVKLGRRERAVVIDSIKGSCAHYGWVLHAVHARTDHVHVVVSSGLHWNLALSRLKAYASRALNAELGRKPKWWTRHGSTILLWGPREVDDCVGYVVDEQGEPLEQYHNKARWDEFMTWEP